MNFILGDIVCPNGKNIVAWNETEDKNVFLKQKYYFILSIDEFNKCLILLSEKQLYHTFLYNSFTKIN